MNLHSIECRSFQNVPLEEEEDDPEFRYLSSDCGIQPNKRNNYGIPKDVIDMFANPQPDRSETESTDENTNTLNHVINSRLEQVNNEFFLCSNSI